MCDVGRSDAETANLGDRPLSPVELVNFPTHVTIISENVRALRPRWLEVAKWSTSVLARAERPTIVDCRFLDCKLASTFLPRSLLIESEYDEWRNSATHKALDRSEWWCRDLNQRSGPPLLDLHRDELAEEVRATRRWHFAPIHVASVWGHSGSSSNAAPQRVNEPLWANSFLRMLSMEMCRISCVAISIVLSASLVCSPCPTPLARWLTWQKRGTKPFPHQSDRLHCCCPELLSQMWLVVVDHLPLDIHLDVSIFHERIAFLRKTRCTQPKLTMNSSLTNLSRG